MRSCSIRVTEMEVSLSSEPLDEIICDAIVNPTDSSGLMRSGVSRILRGVWGPETELQALYYKERWPGHTVLSLAEGLAADRLLHAVVLEEGGTLRAENLADSLKSIFSYSMERGFSVLCIPDFDGFPSPLLPEERAFITVYEARKFILENWPPMEELIIWSDDPRMGVIYKFLLEHPGERMRPDWLRAPLETEIAGGGITKKDVLEAVIRGSRDADEFFLESGVTQTAALRAAVSEITALYAPVYQRISNVTFNCARYGGSQPCCGG
ncbi:MAG: hypothetical protein Q4C86_07380 [bacterium]|nr:hypothetical protein [bacterium]